MSPVDDADAAYTADIAGAALHQRVDDGLRRAGVIPGQREVVVVIADARQWRLHLEQAWHWLDAAQRARVLRQQRAIDRDVRVVAYALQRLLLGYVLGQAPSAVQLERTADGAPVLEGCVGATSLSHAEQHIAIAVDAGQRVGVDIEPLSRCGHLGDIATQICHPSEVRHSSDMPGSQYEQWLLSLWVRKEAVLKAAGVGLSHEMTSFAVSGQSPLALPGCHGHNVCVRMLGPATDYLAAIAMRPQATVTLVMLHPD